MTDIYVIKGDRGMDLDFTLQDSTGAAIDLSLSTITIDVQQEGTTSLKFTRAMSIINATAGQCRYVPAATDFDKVGTYYAEIEVAYPGGKRISFSDINIIVQSDLPK